MSASNWTACTPTRMRYKQPEFRESFDVLLVGWRHEADGSYPMVLRDGFLKPRVVREGDLTQVQDPEDIL